MLRKRILTILYVLIFMIIVIIGCTTPSPNTTYTITASSGEGGYIDPEGEITLEEGENFSFLIIPDEGYQIEAVLVDGVSVGSVGTYTFSNVTQNHIIEAAFALGESEFKIFNLDTGIGYKTIQAAIDAALNGQTILVYPGIFYENLSFDGKDITVQSSNPTDPAIVSTTMIDGGGIDDVSTFHNDDTSTLKGFTIQNGKASKGGGICILHSNPIISNNTIRDNAAVYGGGGIYVYDGDPTIENNIISNNTATFINAISGIWDLEGYGGGICTEFSSSPTIQNNIIIGNTAESGGALYIIAGSTTMTIKENMIKENIAKYGGGMMLESCDATITGNSIVDNTNTGEKISEYGGNASAVYSHGLSNPTIEDNIINDNSTASGYGSVIYLSSYCNATIKNNTITGNTAGNGGGIHIYHSNPEIHGNTISENGITGNGGGITVTYYSNPSITKNTVSGNTAENGGGISVVQSNGTIEDNIITGNTASNNGGGIRLVISGTSIRNNTIENNMAGYQGGGIFLDGSYQYEENYPIITSNTIATNAAENLGGGVYDNTGGWGSPIIGGTDDGDVGHFNTICGNTPDQIEPLYQNNFISIVCD